MSTRGHPGSIYLQNLKENFESFLWAGRKMLKKIEVEWTLNYFLYLLQLLQVRFVYAAGLTRVEYVLIPLN